MSSQRLRNSPDPLEGAEQKVSGWYITHHHIKQCQLSGQEVSKTRVSTHSYIMCPMSHILGQFVCPSCTKSPLYCSQDLLCEECMAAHLDIIRGSLMMNVLEHGGYCSSEIIRNPQLSCVLQIQTHSEDVGCFLQKFFKGKSTLKESSHCAIPMVCK